MRALLVICPLLWMSPAVADDLFLQASGARSTISSQQYAVTRTFDGDGGPGFEAGVLHFNGEGSDWTLARLGISGRLVDDVIARGSVDVGPGRIDGEEISYHKAVLGATWLVSPEWSLDVSDTFINIDDSVGHVAGVSVSYLVARRLGLTLDAMSSVGGNLDTEQLGAKFRWYGPTSYLGGVYAGETRNPILLSEFGNEFGTRAVRLRQAYAGVEIPVGRITLLTLFDYRKLDDTIRREVTIVVKIPFDTGADADR